MATRIVNLTEVSSLQDGDFIVIDNSSNGTHKFKAVELGGISSQNIASDYSSASPYAVGQICMYGGDLYECNTAITSGESWNASHWTQITVGIALYNKADAKAVGDAFDSLETTLKAGTEATADYHLGFYLDENGDLCQVDE